MNQDDWYPTSQDEGDKFKVNIHQRTEELYFVNDRIPDEGAVILAPVIILEETVVFPHMVSPIYVKAPSDLLAIEAAQEERKTLVALTAINKDETIEDDAQEYLPIAVEMAVGRLLTMVDGNHSALVQSRRRVELIEFTQTKPFRIAKFRVVDESFSITQRLTALMRAARNLFKSCVDMNHSLPEEAYIFSLNITDPGWLSDTIATTLSLPDEQRQELLMTIDPVSRLKRLNQLLAEEIEVLTLEDEIQSQVQTEVDRTQREYYLREQLKVIQNELGEGDIWTREIIELNEQIENTPLPKETMTQVKRELTRLKQMPSMAPEAGIIRTYIDWILEIPWGNASEDNLDVKNAQKVLAENHYGLNKAKDRILEYIAVRSLKPKKNRQPILCFVGPPGTGKTSLGKSIAESLGRQFVRLSLGGVRDEAEIRGHRRTYIGALPGRVIQTMRRAGTTNPLFMLDEIDKVGADFRGDPSAALLEVLDPEQNYAFSDHYLEVAYDLSKVLFITTANSLGNIPSALLDRMEVIDFPGYIEEEKLEIANRFLIPRQIEETGLDDEPIKFAKSALQKIIREYTYEAGVRNLEREIGHVLRRIARLKSEGKAYPKQITSTAVARFLGPVQFFTTEAEGQDEVGVATAIAWTENGGEIMPVEVLILDGKGNLQITGQIGDVMQESAQAALSYLKSRAAQFEIEEEYFEGIDIHLHIPEGAIPKDGPSAGITIATALVSAVTQMPVHHDVGMTGEITLRGRILPIGGVREKVLAAHRAGLKTVLIPSKNMKDLSEVPQGVKRDMKLLPVNHMDEVLALAIDANVKKASTRKTKKNTKNNETTPV
ncbi:MAG: endopeptidase La [Anaerolineaceae bacterium]|nr:endopeptidase La [Anaerolineaceae bacterium]